MKRYILLFSVVTIIMGLVFAVPAFTAKGGGGGGSESATERVSVSSGGAEGNEASIGPATISAYGRYVAFSSWASNLLEPNGTDTNSVSDVFVRDRLTGVVTRVSVSSAGVEGNGNSSGPSISADGRYVAFTSEATTFLPNDTNLGRADVFVHDRFTGETTLVSVLNGEQIWQGSGAPSISADGRYVSFTSQYASYYNDVFVHDRVTGETVIISTTPTGERGNGNSGAAQISANGRYVAFMSTATNLGSNGNWQILVYDGVTGLIEPASISDSGELGNNLSQYPSISGDGRHVAFMSKSNNLYPGFNGDDILVRDRVAGTTRPVSVTSDGIPANDLSADTAISGNGRFVVFTTRASNFDPVDPLPRSWDIYVKDLWTGALSLASISNSGVVGDGRSGGVSISADGQYVGFQSFSTNLVNNDNNGFLDVFLNARCRLLVEP